jgi:hypothetical protein
MHRKASFLIVLSASALLAACGDTFRYPCQDPAKANSAECSCTNPNAPRTKNKALNAVESGATTTTLRPLAGFDC